MQKQFNINKAALLTYVLIIPLALVYTNQTLDKYLSFRFLYLGILLFLMSILIMKNWYKKTISIKKTSLLFLVFFILFIIQSLVSLFITRNKADGLFELYKILLFFILICLIQLYNFDINTFKNNFTGAILLMNIAVIAIGIAQLISTYLSDGLAHLHIYKINVTFGHKNLFAQILLISLPFNLYTFYNHKKIKIVRWLSLSCFILCLFFITILMSRAVWIAFFTGLIISLIIAIKTRIFPFFKRTLIPIVSVITIGLTIVFYTQIDHSAAFQKQFKNSAKLNYGSVSDRINLWKNSLKTFKKKPLIGNGLASWKIEVLQYGNKKLKSVNNITFYQRPHNDYIWILSEQGILGLLWYLIIFCFALVICYKSLLKQEVKKDTKLFIMGILFSLICFITFSFFSFPKDRIYHNVMLAFLLGAVVLINESTNTKEKYIVSRYSLYYIFSFVIITLSAIPIGITRLKSEIHFKNAYLHKQNESWGNLVSASTMAKSYIYNIDPFSTPIDWYTGLGHFKLREIETAQTYFQNALKANPYHIHVLNNLGTTFGLQSNNSTAIKYFKKALKIAPNYTDAHKNLIASYYKTGNNDSAIFHIMQIINKIDKNEFNQYAELIIKPELLKMSETIDEVEIKEVIKGIANDNKWVHTIFRKARKNDNHIIKQILIDAIYSLHIIDKKINHPEAKRLYKKYNLL